MAYDGEPARRALETAAELRIALGDLRVVSVPVELDGTPTDPGRR